MVFEDRTEDLDFSGKRVLITGVAGIEVEMAKTFGEYGAPLILADIKKIQKMIVRAFRACENNSI